MFDRSPLMKIMDMPLLTSQDTSLTVNKDLILESQMVCLIVDNRMPAEVTSCRNLVGPQEELTEVLLNGFSIVC